MNRSTSAHKSLVLKYYLATGLSSAHFILPITLLYGTTQLGFSFTQTASIYTVQLLSSVFFDFIGGAFADKFSKKGSFIIGAVVHAFAGVLSFVILDSFIIFLPLAVVAGFGIALMSGSLSAIIANNIMPSDHALYIKANSGAHSSLFISRAFSSVAGGLLYVFHPTLPYLLYFLALIFAALTVYTIKDDAKNELSEEIKPFKELMGFAVQSFKKHPLTLLMPIVAMSIASIGMDSLFGYYQPYFSANGLAENYLGYLYAAISMIGAVGALFSRKIKKDYHAIMAILFLTGIQGIVFAFFDWRVALVSVTLLAFASGLYSPVLRLIINEHSENSYRSSALSVGSSLSMIGTIIGLQLAAIAADHGTVLMLGLGVVATQIIAATFFVPYYRAVAVKS